MLRKKHLNGVAPTSNAFVPLAFRLQLSKFFVANEAAAFPISHSPTCTRALREDRATLGCPPESRITIEGVKAIMERTHRGDIFLPITLAKNFRAARRERRQLG